MPSLPLVTGFVCVCRRHRWSARYSRLPLGVLFNDAFRFSQQQYVACTCVPLHVYTTCNHATRNHAAGQLRRLAKDMKVFPTNNNDVKFYKTRHQDIGESQPVNLDLGRAPY